MFEYDLTKHHMPDLSVRRKSLNLLMTCLIYWTYPPECRAEIPSKLQLSLDEVAQSILSHIAEMQMNFGLLVLRRDVVMSLEAFNNHCIDHKTVRRNSVSYLARTNFFQAMLAS
jgi:hypothetical protein